MKVGYIKMKEEKKKRWKKVERHRALMEDGKEKRIKS